MMAQDCAMQRRYGSTSSSLQNVLLSSGDRWDRQGFFSVLALVRSQALYLHCHFRESSDAAEAEQCRVLSWRGEGLLC